MEEAGRLSEAIRARGATDATPCKGAALNELNGQNEPFPQLTDYILTKFRNKEPQSPVIKGNGVSCCGEGGSLTRSTCHLFEPP
jgi:hypothetical protein